MDTLIQIMGKTGNENSNIVVCLHSKGGVMQRQCIWLAVLFVGVIPALATPAHAKTEDWCYKQYNLMQQAAIDRRALGGDQRALLTRAACSWPLTDTGEKLEEQPAKKVVINGYFWTTLAYCRAEDPQNLPRGAITKASRWQWQRQIKGLKQRFESVRSEIDERGADVKQAAYNEYEERLAKLGPAGLIELARSSSCAIGADSVTTAGIWLAAYEAWQQLEKQLNPKLKLQECTKAAVKAAAGPGKPWVWSTDGSKDALDPCQEYLDASEHITTALGKRQVQEKAASLLLGEPSGMGHLREQAAVAHMNVLDVSAIQWALYVLGKYHHAIDGDYGSSTIKAIKTEQHNWMDNSASSSPDKEGWLLEHVRDDGWLTHQEARALICQASLQPKRPGMQAIALGYLAYMYEEGIGFPQDLLKARAILNFALPHLDELLQMHGLDPNKKATLKALKDVLSRYPESIEQKIEENRLTNARPEPFEASWDYLCPGVYKTAGEQP